MLLYLKNKIEAKNTYEFIKKYMFELDRPTSYNDKECVDLQCYGDKHRSFQDLYAIINSQMQISKNELATVLIKLSNEELTVPIRCPDVQDIVFVRNCIGGYNSDYGLRKTSKSDNSTRSLVYKSEDGNQQYSMQEILDLSYINETFLLE